jgi:hypothetical protein
VTPLGLGDEEGAPCGRGLCDGVIVISYDRDGCCSCHLGAPPCGYCTSGVLTCSECDWTEGDDD